MFGLVSCVVFARCNQLMEESVASASGHPEGLRPGRAKVLETENGPNSACWGVVIRGEIPDSQGADCIEIGVWFSLLQRCRILENIS